MNKDHWGQDASEASSEGVEKIESGVAKGAQSVPANSKEWRLIEKMVGGLHAEHRRTRRWGIFFKSLTFLYLFALLGIYWGAKNGDEAAQVVSASEPHVAVVDVDGVIAAKEQASAEKINAALKRAFDDSSAKAVVLNINSPGGSPVQAGYVYDEIKRQRGLHPDKKVYAVIADIGASGAYYIAAAADDIYADKASLVGSIGVISSSFGFVDLMKKVGVERRMLTSGAHKGLLDPFSPLPDSERQFWQTVLDTTHQQFIDQVKKGRGDRLKVQGHEDEMFSGLVWTGEQALDLGLIDGLGSVDSVARDVVGVEKKVDYTSTPNKFERLIDRLGVSMASELANQMGLTAGVEMR